MVGKSALLSEPAAAVAVVETPPQGGAARRPRRSRRGDDQLELASGGLDPATFPLGQPSKKQRQFHQAQTSSNEEVPPVPSTGAPAEPNQVSCTMDAGRSPPACEESVDLEAEVPRLFSLDRALQPWSSELMHTRLEDMFLGGDFETRGRQLSRPTPTQFSTLPDLTFEAVATAHSARRPDGRSSGAIK